MQLLPVYEGIDRKDMVMPLTIMPLDKALSKLSQVEYRANSGEMRLSKEKPSDTLVLTYTGPGGLMIEKKLIFHNNSYKVDIELNTRGMDGYDLSLGTDFGIADKVSSDASGRVGLVAVADGKSITEKIEDIKGEVQHAGNVDWFGQSDKYFTATIVYGKQGIITSKRSTAPKENGDLLATTLTVKDKPEARTFSLYAGPKSFTLLEAQGHGLEQMVDYGWFGILAKPMFWLMEKFFIITRNYGIAIILLTIVVRIILFIPPQERHCHGGDEEDPAAAHGGQGEVQKRHREDEPGNDEALQGTQGESRRRMFAHAPAASVLCRAL